MRGCDAVTVKRGLELLATLADNDHAPLRAHRLDRRQAGAAASACRRSDGAPCACRSACGFPALRPGSRPRISTDSWPPPLHALIGFSIEEGPRAKTRSPARCRSRAITLPAEWSWAWPAPACAPMRSNAAWRVVLFLRPAVLRVAGLAVAAFAAGAFRVAPVLRGAARLATGLEEAVAVAPPSSAHLPDSTRCAASATASAITEPNFEALVIIWVAAWLALSAASSPASRIALRALGLAAIAAAAAVKPGRKHLAAHRRFGDLVEGRLVGTAAALAAAR